MNSKKRIAHFEVVSKGAYRGLRSYYNIFIALSWKASY